MWLSGVLFGEFLSQMSVISVKKSTNSGVKKLLEDSRSERYIYHRK
jgi:hypothetical protein